MAYLKYKIGDDIFIREVVNVPDFASNDSTLYSTSNITSGYSSYDVYSEPTSAATGTYPTLTSSVPYTSIEPLGCSCRARIYSSSGYSDSNIFYDPVKSKLTSILSGAVPVYTCSYSDTVSCDIVNEAGDSSGATISYSNGNFILQFSGYSGHMNAFLSIPTTLTQSDTTMSVWVAKMGNVYGLYASLDGAYTGYSSRYIMYTGIAYRYFIDNTSSPLYEFLKRTDSIKEPSGSDSSDGSNPAGGSGNYSFPSSDIDSSDDLPATSPAIAAGLVNAYLVTSGEIASLGSFLWSDSFYDSIAKTFSNPMDCIISLSSFPVASSSMSLGSSESVRVGNTTSSSTGTRLISEFVTIDCGSVSVPEVWGSYLDYAQTKLYIYIPYLGIEELPLCECMGGSVACKLRINLLTGALVACLTLTSGTYVTGSARKQPIYFSTTCKSDIPVSGATTGALAGAFQLLGGAVSTVAGIASGTAPVAVAGLASAAQGVATMQSQNSQISGAIGAAGGQMAHKTPFLIFDRPVQSVPANLASVAGYQSNSGTTLSRCSGYVICDTINLDGLALTRSELEEVEQICTSGVYIS